MIRGKHMNGSNTISLYRMDGRSETGMATFGSYWGKGLVDAKGACFDLSGKAGNVPVQSRITAYWPDGSVKWACHVADSSLLGKECTLTAVDNDGAVKRTDDKDIEIVENEDNFKIILDNGEITINKKGQNLAENYIRDGHKVINKIWSELVLQRREGKEDSDLEMLQNERFLGQVTKATVKECGSIRSVVKIEGIHKSTQSSKENIPVPELITPSPNSKTSSYSIPL